MLVGRAQGSTLAGLPRIPFGLRTDRNGYRPVFPLGNSLGRCPYDCVFCNVKATRRVDPREAVDRFEALWDQYRAVIDGPYHPVVYNQGNGTNPRELAPAVLDHVLETFRGDSRVVFLSLNSREAMATPAVLDSLCARRLGYPIHFVFGQETFSPCAEAIIGKRVHGELDRFMLRLERYNRETDAHASAGRYHFGLDVNLLFLPELYLAAGESRVGNDAKVRGGLRREVEVLLSKATPLVPLQINIHPYVQVESLPYETADVSVLLDAVRDISSLVEGFNATRCYPTYVFLGVEGVQTDRGSVADETERITKAVERFNRFGFMADSADARTPGSARFGNRP